MKSIIKNEIHQFIDRIDNDEFLEEFFIFLKNRFSKNHSLLIEKLSKTEKKELIASYKESFNKENLIEHDSVKKEYKKWLN